MHSRLKAVLFDLDGTLIDSLPDIAAAVNRVLAAHHRPLLAESAVRPMIGDGADRLVERAFAASGGMPVEEVGPLLAQFLAEYEPRAAELTRPFPGVTETLERLRSQGLLLAVCTNKPSVATAEVLEAFGLSGYFAVVVGSDDTPALKPDPRHVQACLDRLGCPADQAVMVGDSANDVIAAKAAGVATVVVTFGYSRSPVAELGADRVIERFGDLVGVVGETQFR